MLAGKRVRGKECKGEKSERGKGCGKKSEGKSVTGRSVRGEKHDRKMCKGEKREGEKCECFHESHLIKARQDHWFAQDPLTSERINISLICLLVYLDQDLGKESPICCSS